MVWQKDDIALFVTVVESGSFSKASIRLDMPNSTVSRRVAQLEEKLGVRLLERNSRKLSLTSQGQLLFDQCQNAVKQIEAGITKTLDGKDSLSGKLRISCPVHFGSHTAADWFIEFKQRYPKILLDIKLENAIVDLIEEQCDIAFRLGPLKDSTYIARHLFDFETVMCASPEYIQAGGVPQQPEDLNHHDLLLLQQTLKLGFEQDKTGQYETRQLAASISSNAIEVILKAMHGHLGIGVLPLNCVREALDNQRLIQVLPTYRITPARSMYMVYSSKTDLHKNLQIFVDFILGKIKKEGV